MEKRGLGRGLAALISDTMSEDGEGQVREIPLSQIAANPMQPRTLFDPIKQEELVASIREHGVLQPVLLRRVGHERYQLVAGERRVRAAGLAGMAAIPALVKECSEREQLELAIVENVQREDIGPIEAARAYRRMADEFGMTQETIAARVGKSRTAITNTLGLLDLPEEIQDSVERGEISEGHARALKAIRDPAGLVRAWQTVVRRGLSVREAERLAKEMRSPAALAGAPAGAPPASVSAGVPEPARSVARSDPNEDAVLERLQELLRTRVSLRRAGGGSGRLEIEFYSAEDFERIAHAILGGPA